MKRKGYVVDLNEEGKAVIVNDGKQITCEVCGEMADGTKCWYNIEEIDKETYVPYSDAYWYSLHKTDDGIWYFFLEGC